MSFSLETKKTTFFVEIKKSKGGAKVSPPLPKCPYPNPNTDIMIMVTLITPKPNP